MVLGVDLVKWLVLLVCAFVTACGGSAEKPRLSNQEHAESSRQSDQGSIVVTDTAKVSGYKLQLLNKQGTCAIRYEGSTEGQVEIAPKPACYFLRRQSTQPQSFSYPELQIEALLIVVGTPIKEETRGTWTLPADLVCGEETQAVLIKNGKVIVSAVVHRGGVVCKDQGVDEKEFWAFAHDDVEAQ
jgi:hypothetical protein